MCMFKPVLNQGGAYTAMYGKCTGPVNACQRHLLMSCKHRLISRLVCYVIMQVLLPIQPTRWWAKRLHCVKKEHPVLTINCWRQLNCSVRTRCSIIGVLCCSVLSNATLNSVKLPRCTSPMATSPAGSCTVFIYFYHWACVALHGHWYIYALLCDVLFTSLTMKHEVWTLRFPVGGSCVVLFPLMNYL